MTKIVDFAPPVLAMFDRRKNCVITSEATYPLMDAGHQLRLHPLTSAETVLTDTALPGICRRLGYGELEMTTLLSHVRCPWRVLTGFAQDGAPTDFLHRFATLAIGFRYEKVSIQGAAAVCPYGAPNMCVCAEAKGDYEHQARSVLGYALGPTVAFKSGRPSWMAAALEWRPDARLGDMLRWSNLSDDPCHALSARFAIECLEEGFVGPLAHWKLRVHARRLVLLNAFCHRALFHMLPPPGVLDLVFAYLPWSHHFVFTPEGEVYVREGPERARFLFVPPGWTSSDIVVAHSFLYDL